MHKTTKLVGAAAVGTMLLMALPAFAQTSSTTDTSGTGYTTSSASTSGTGTSVGTPNTGAGGDLAVNLSILTTSALAALAGGAYLARKRLAL